MLPMDYNQEKIIHLITHFFMQRKWLVRISFALFLFSVGYLVGGGLRKTIRHITQETQSIKLHTAYNIAKPNQLSAVL